MSVYRLDKHTEREIARRLNGQRTGHLGGADVQTDWLAVEVKTRRTLPAWLLAAMQQARGNAGVAQLPITVLHQQGQRHDDDLVLLSLADFIEHFGG